MARPTSSVSAQEAGSCDLTSAPELCRTRRWRWRRPLTLALAGASVLALLAGCSAQPRSARPILSNVAPADTSPPPPRRPDIMGTWTGTYLCTQGRTGLDLHVVIVDEAHVVAIFEFYPVPGNMGVPRGSLQVTGTLTETGRLSLQAGDWIERPEGYVGADMDGQISDDGTRYDGRIVGVVADGCAAFNLTRKTE